MKIDNPAIEDLDQALKLVESRPKIVFVGDALFKALNQSGRIHLEDGVLSFAHFLLDGDIEIAIDKALKESEFRFSKLK